MKYSHKFLLIAFCIIAALNTRGATKNNYEKLARIYTNIKTQIVNYKIDLIQANPDKFKTCFFRAWEQLHSASPLMDNKILLTMTLNLRFLALERIHQAFLGKIKEVKPSNLFFIPKNTSEEEKKKLVQQNMIDIENYNRYIALSNIKISVERLYESVMEGTFGIIEGGVFSCDDIESRIKPLILMNITDKDQIDALMRRLQTAKEKVCKIQNGK